MWNTVPRAQAWSLAVLYAVCWLWCWAEGCELSELVDGMNDDAVADMWLGACGPGCWLAGWLGWLAGLKDTGTDVGTGEASRGVRQIWR